eukprot:1137447-Pelagomonas_calceolata.AAC.1
MGHPVVENCYLHWRRSYIIAGDIQSSGFDIDPSQPCKPRRRLKFFLCPWEGHREAGLATKHQS